MRTLNGIDDENILKDIFDNNIIIYEDIQGSKIWVNWDGEEFIIKNKSLSNKPINMIDLAMQNFYNRAFEYFNSLDKRVKSLLNKKWWFCFEYFPDTQPANIEYDKMPKNNLILTYINKGRNKYDFNIDELNEYARLLGVDVIPIIYKGRLTENQKEAIKHFINTSEKDIEYVFGEKNFAYFFYKILNPASENSFLMNDFQKNIEKLIIKIDNGDDNDNISFQLLNPLYKKLEIENDTDFTEIYTLILVNFLNFCQSIDITNIKLSGETKEEIYINFISDLYNIYLSSTKDDLLEFEFIIPDFFDKEKFKINTELINNELTISYIEEHPKLEYIFKSILGSFNKKKKTPIGVFSKNTVVLFNKYIDEIEDMIDIYLGKGSEIEMNKQGLLDFSDFFDIKYDVDGSGDVYPDIYDEFSKGLSDDKKKKKGGYYKGDGDIMGKFSDKL